MTRTLEVVNRPLKYATRRLMPGDVFEAKDRDARVLLYAGRVRPARHPGDLPPPPPALVAKVADIAALRANYEAKFGKRPFMGWNAETLAIKLAEA